MAFRMINARIVRYMYIYIYIYIYIFFFLWRCDPTRVMASSFLRFLDHTQRRTTVGRTPLDEWLLVAETSTWQHTTLTTDKHPCPRWDSNPRSQQASLLTWRKWWTPNNASKWQMGFNSAFKGLIAAFSWLIHLNDWRSLHSSSLHTNNKISLNFPFQ